MNFIKRYWFGGLLAFIVCCFCLLFVLLIISPKQDAKNRGFVKCTQQMIDDVGNCNKAFLCSVKAIGNNTLCDVKVVTEGFKLWLDNQQPYPWSNYIFEPEIEKNPFYDDEGRDEYLKNNPNIKKEMIKLEKLRKELENEENKQNFDEEMLPKE
ncbi:MAG: hypothetical protein IKA30_05370 [Alphaproteobacteria bacterium]|nr:hypothetical protein [Alphaproteobacteria bacterium]